MRGANVLLAVAALGLTATAYLAALPVPGARLSPLEPEARVANAVARERSTLAAFEPRGDALRRRASEPDADVAQLRPREAPRDPVLASRARIEALVRDLANDDRDWNAMRAVYRLRKIGAPAAPYLKVALRSRDRQQRQLAAHLLFDLAGEPTPQLLAVAVEALEHDRLPYDPGGASAGDRRVWIHNAEDASRFLAKHPVEARPWLRTRLHAADRQQRFLAACLLAWGGTTEELAPTVRVLGEHLQDNDLRCDAAVSASALAHVGAAALPHLRIERAKADAQARSILDFLIEQAERPTTSPATVGERLERHGVRRWVHVEDFWRRPLIGSVPRFNDADARIDPAPAS